MGFPVGFSDLLFPRFLFLLLSLLGHLRKLIAFTLRAAGLGDLLFDPADTEPSQDPNRPAERRHHIQLQPHSAAARIQSLLPAGRYGDLISCGAAVGDQDGALESCAVCLHDFCCADEVRRLSNCRHVFHTGCIDPWVELDQRTCPLCRAPFVSDELLLHCSGASELDWVTGHSAGENGESSIYTLADPFLTPVSPQSETPLPWSLLPPDAAAAVSPELNIW